MGNLTSTTLDSGAVATRVDEMADEILTFASGVTIKKGTIIARLLRVLAVTPTGPGGTGNGTLTAVTVIAGEEVPKAGNWTLRCTIATTNGGTWRLEDPDGSVRVSGLIMTAGAGAATAFKAAGLGFTITDGSTDFAVGDTFTLPVVASSKCVVYATAGAGGAQRPLGVLLDDYTRASAGDLAIRLLRAGEVVKERLIIDADGNGTNITAEILDRLAAAGVVSVSVQQVAKVDN